MRPYKYRLSPTELKQWEGDHYTPDGRSKKAMIIANAKIYAKRNERSHFEIINTISGETLHYE